jgi:hypothetical protein
MKKVLAGVVLALATLPAMAQWHHGHHGYRGGYYGGGWGWVVPAVIGGAVVYGATRPDPVIVQQQPVIVQNPPTVVYQPRENCTAWTETQQSDGTITRTRTCTQ